MSKIETERLELIDPKVNQGPFFFELLNTPGWIEHIGDRGIKSIQDAENYISKSIMIGNTQNGYGLYTMILKSTNKPIGICGLLLRDELEHPDIGFALLPAYEGKGFTTEAGMATVKFAKEVLQIKTILGITGPNNKASIRVLEKLGLRFLKKFQFKDYNDESLLFSTKNNG